MLNFLVETKKEYTIQLSNLLYLKIYEGFNALYKKSIEKTVEDEVLKNFQKSLKKIPKWDSNLINNETHRVCSENIDIIENLLKAIIKSNILMLTFDPRKNQPKANDIIYDDITINRFVHQIYIESAREIFNNPFLFYHKYNPLELKRNQRETFTLIKKCIEDSIRNLLPMKEILNIYLGGTDNPSEVIDKISEKQYDINNDILNQLGVKQTQNNPIQQNPIFMNSNQPQINLSNAKQNIPNDVQMVNQNDVQMVNQNDVQMVNNQNDIQIGGNKDTIQSVLERNNVVLSPSSNVNKNFIRQVQENETINKLNQDDKKSLDSKIKEILNKDLKDSDVEASLSYKPEITENYQEVFGNEDVKDQTKVTKEETINSINTAEKKNLMRKNKFFNNYLSF